VRIDVTYAKGAHRIIETSGEAALSSQTMERSPEWRGRDLPVTAVMMRPRVDLVGSGGMGLAVEICAWSSDRQRGGTLARLTDLGGTREVPRLLFHVFRVWEVLPADELEHVVDIDIDGRIHLARIAGRLVDLTAYECLERRLLSGAEIHERAFEQRVLIVHDRLRWEYPKDDNEALGDRYGLGSFLYDYASRLSGNHDPDENEGENDDRPQALADGFDDICNAIASAASDQEAVDALADAMLGDPDLMPYVLERALEARGMDIGRLDDLWDEAERIVAEQAGWGDGFSEG
jgi:hypothetical protein